MIPLSRVTESSLRRDFTAGLVVFLVALPLCLGISFQADSPVPLFVPLTVFLVGLFWLFYAYIFGESPFAANPAGRLGQPRFTTSHGESLPPPKRF